MRTTFIIFISIFSSVLLAAEKQSIASVMLSTEEYPPLIGSKQKHYGLISHIIKEAFILENIDVKYQFFPAARSLMVARNGQVEGTFPWAYRANREGDFYYSDPIISVGEEHFYFKNNAMIKWDPSKSNYNDIKGLTVGVITSYDYGDAFRQAINNKVIKVIKVTTLIQLFKMLFADHIDMLISKELIAEYTLQGKFNPLEIAQLKSIPERLAPPTFDYLLFSKNNPKSKFLLNAFNLGLKKLHASGKFNEFINNYKEGGYLRKATK